MIIKINKKTDFEFRFKNINDQANRYNLGPLYANKNLLKKLGYYD
jgi:hypothetical protein